MKKNYIKALLGASHNAPVSGDSFAEALSIFALQQGLLRLFAHVAISSMRCVGPCGFEHLAYELDFTADARCFVVDMASLDRSGCLYSA